MNVSLSFKVVVSLEYQIKLYISTIWQWMFIVIQNIILKGHPIIIHWNKSFYMTIILDVSYKVVWCLMTQSWIYSGTSDWNYMWKCLIVILQRQRTTKCICTGGNLKTFNRRKALMKVLILYVHIYMPKNIKCDNICPIY